MPALVAARFNPDMEAKYTHLIKTGKPALGRDIYDVRARADLACHGKRQT